MDDLDAALARLDEHGVPLIGGPMPRGDGYDQVFMRDPDGYVIELFQHTGAGSERRTAAGADPRLTRNMERPSAWATVPRGESRERPTGRAGGPTCFLPAYGEALADLAEVLEVGG